MKKKILSTMIVALLLGAIATGFAKTPAEKSVMSSSKEIQKIITESVKYPDWGYKKGLHGEVVITFKVTAEGKIDLKNISCQSDELKEYVKDQLNTLTIQDVIHPLNQQYKVKLNFEMS